MDKRKAENKGGLTVKTGPPSGGFVVPGERLYLNATRDLLVPAGHKDAAYLYCTEASSVPRAELEGLKRYRKPGRPKGSKTKAKG